MTDINHSYPFDPTGTKGSNRIVGEKHALSPPAWKDYHFIIPKLAPFFRDSIKIRECNTGRELVEGTDWMASHRFIDASRSTARPIYGSITFYDKTLSGVVEIEYQTLGGDWTIDGDAITQLLVHTSSNPRITTWEEIVDLPFQFPVIDHDWHLDDLIGMSHVKKAIEDVSQTILDTRDVRPIVRRHLSDEDNPHNVTKSQVGLGDVENFAPSTRSQALDGVHDESYMTPRRVRQSIEKYGYNYTDKHEGRKDNPHSVTKRQVGLGDVENFGLSTRGQAESADGNDSYMTPERVGEAIQARVRFAFDKHADDHDNPHQVTKDQVGLGYVMNHPPASRSDAETGAREDRVMSPLRVRQAIVRFAHSYTDDHEKRSDNPHQVTQTQVGLSEVQNYGIATKTQAEKGNDNDAYMTPLRTQEAVKVLVRDDLDAHTAATNNPHSVTKEQVGLGDVKNFGIALDIEAEQGVVRDKYMTPRNTKLAIDSQVSASYYKKEHIDSLIGSVTVDLPLYINHLTVNLQEDPHEVTKGDLGLGDVVDDTFMVSEEVVNTLFDRVTDLNLFYNHQKVNPHELTKSDFGLGDAFEGPYLTMRDIDEMTNIPATPDPIIKYVLVETFDG